MVNQCTGQPVLRVPDIARETDHDIPDTADQFRKQHREKNVDEKDQQRGGNKRADHTDRPHAPVLGQLFGSVKDQKDQILDELHRRAQDIGQNEAVNNGRKDRQEPSDPRKKDGSPEQYKI